MTWSAQIEQKAYHEAGHAVARLRQEIPFERVVIDPDPEGRSSLISGAPLKGFEGTNFSAPADLSTARRVDWSQAAREVIRGLMVSAAAGPLAQMKSIGETMRRGESDLLRFGGTDDLAWIRGYALGLAAPGEHDDARALALKQELIGEALAAALQLVDTCWPAISATAAELLKRRSLTMAEVEACVTPPDTPTVAPAL